MTPEPATASVPSYAAFISYSHAADGRLAPAVERGLERLARPWYRRRALRIFRDDSGLALTPALWPAIATALDQSKYLVLLASPRAAKSEWVNQEVEHWKETKPTGRILLAVTEGECQWDRDRGDFDPEQSTAIPPSVLGIFTEQPKYGDFRQMRSETQLDLRHSAFRCEIAKIAAPIHGRAMDALESEDIHLHRRAIRLAWSVATTLALLLVMVSIAGTVAVFNARRANTEARLALARALAAQATANREQQPLSLLLSLESLQLASIDEGWAALQDGLLHPRHNVLVITGHTDAVNGVAFSPDGKMIASAGGDETVRLWETTTGKAIGEPLTGHLGSVNSVAFSPDGKMIASAGGDETVRLWETTTGKAIGEPLTGHLGSVNSVAFSPDGKMIASAGQDRTVRLWDSATGKAIGGALAGHTDAVNSVVFSPDGKMIASAGQDRTVRLWETATGKAIGEPLTGHTLSVFTVAFSPDGKTIASAGQDRTVRLWQTVASKPIGDPLTGHTDAVTSVAFSPDTKVIASAGPDGTVRSWETATGKAIGPLLTGTGAIWGVAFNPEGKLIASAGDDGTVRLWEAFSGKPIGQPLTGHTGFVRALAFSPDGKTIASAGQDRTVRLWNIATGREIHKPLTGHTDAVYAIAFSPDGKIVASAGGDQTVRLWEAATGRAIGQPLTGHTGGVHAVAFSPDGKTIASAWRRPNSTAVGGCHRQGDRPAPDRPYRRRVLRGVQPGRQDDCLRRQRPNGAAVAGRERCLGATHLRSGRAQPHPIGMESIHARQAVRVDVSSLALWVRRARKTKVGSAPWPANLVDCALSRSNPWGLGRSR